MAAYLEPCPHPKKSGSAAPASAAAPAATTVLQEMVDMMESGDEHGASSEWYKRAKAALAAHQPPAQDGWTELAAVFMEKSEAGYSFSKTFATALIHNHAQDGAASQANADRCKHGVWAADHCYQCEKEQAQAKQAEQAEDIPTEGWLIEWDDTHGHRRKVSGHNCVADYRAIYQDVTVAELVRRDKVAARSLPRQALTDAGKRTLKRAIDCLEILDKRPRPMCRDCADNFGTCPNDGLECDMRKLIKGARAIEQHITGGGK